MNFKQTMAELKKCGSAQTRKTYARHGVKGEIFGVSYADHGKLKKKIGVDHDLAVQLWATGNHAQTGARSTAQFVAGISAVGRAGTAISCSLGICTQ